MITKKKKKTLNDLKKKLMEITAKDIMTSEVITTTEDVFLADVAEIMVKKRISGLPVVSSKKKDSYRIKGIITSNDLFLVMDLIKSGDIIDENLIPVSNPTVKFAMSNEVFEIHPATTLDEIITLMKFHNVYTIPVVNKKKIVGVIGRRDVFSHFYAVEKNFYS